MTKKPNPDCEVRDALRRLLMWFNRDGSPCDGFRLREEVVKARRVLGMAKDGYMLGKRAKGKK